MVRREQMRGQGGEMLVERGRKGKEGNKGGNSGAE